MESQIENFVQFCRDNSLSLTPQRLAIYKALTATDEHPDAEAIYEEVRREFPMISLGTIYKTLETFSTLGLIWKVNVLHETARYDANLDQHHHMICTNCKGAWDLYDESFDQLPLEQAERHRFKVHSLHVQLIGLCAECQKAGTD